MYSRTVLVGISGTSSPLSMGSSQVLSRMCGWSASPRVGMLANCSEAPANGRGKRTGRPPRSSPRGRKVLPKKSRSSLPSGRSVNFATAVPYCPGNWMGTCGKFGLTRIRARSAVLKKAKLNLSVPSIPRPVVRSRRPLETMPGKSVTLFCCAGSL